MPKSAVGWTLETWAMEESRYVSRRNVPTVTYQIKKMGNPRLCRTCSVLFSDIDALNDHCVETTHSAWHVVCQPCDRAFRTTFALQDVSLVCFIFFLHSMTFSSFIAYQVSFSCQTQSNLHKRPKNSGLCRWSRSDSHKQNWSPRPELLLALRTQVPQSWAINWTLPDIIHASLLS